MIGRSFSVPREWWKCHFLEALAMNRKRALKKT
jgi:hypothetical protein